jgi:ribonucleoside-diphosphate reductase alpha chain
MSIKSLSDYTVFAKYSHYIPEEKKRETWSQAVNRVFDMHKTKYKEKIVNNEELKKDIDFALEYVLKKRVLGAQRTLQFGGSSILKHELKSYNCSFTHCDRPKVFSEINYALLCGTGVGVSVQYKHVKKLPKIHKRSNEEYIHNVEDSIEGWSDAFDILFNSFIKGNKYSGKKIKFKFDKIRPKGSLINGQFKAPGPEGLKQSLKYVADLIDKRIESNDFNKGEFAGKLRPIDCYDFIAHMSDSVLSGGVRRSALIILFSLEDSEMMSAKTGNWFEDSKQRARSNNSVVIERDNCSSEKFYEIFSHIRQFGEPGFYFIENGEFDVGANPCVEIGLYPKTEDGRSGFQLCNLSEINGKYCKDEESFYEACKAASIIGTLQAGYTDFKYLSPETKEIAEREALLGVSITGLMDNPEILFDEKIQKKGAEIVKQTNKRVAKLLEINPAARTCCIKPSGSASCVLGTASGIHPGHAHRYFRRVQANESEFSKHVFQKINPFAVEKSVWSATDTDYVITFPCEVAPGSVVKNQIDALSFLEKVKSTQKNWVLEGTNRDLCVNKNVNHNVSVTITVKENEWEDVAKYIYDNRKYFTGISLLGESGDLDYQQAPFATVLTPNEMVREYGDASIFASGLVVDGLAAFDNNIWDACDYVLVEKTLNHVKEPEYPSSRNYKELANYFTKKVEYETYFKQKDWIRRFKQFAERYFDNNYKKTTYCLKHVYLWKQWCDMKREWTDIDWSNVIEENQEFVDADTLAAQSCAGGKCEIF